jgi:hypothetical protein
MKTGKRVGGYAGKQKHTTPLDTRTAECLTHLFAYPLTILPAYPRIIFC